MPGRTSRLWPATSSSAGSKTPSRNRPGNAAFAGPRRSSRKASVGPAAGQGASTASAPADRSRHFSAVPKGLTATGCAATPYRGRGATGCAQARPTDSRGRCASEAPGPNRLAFCVPDDRETQLLRACVELAGALLDDFDIAEFLHLLTRRVSEVLDVAEVGILLVDGGTLQVMASSTERTRNVELFQLHSDEGPCMECFRSGTAVIVEDLDAERERWPSYVPAAQAAGFASVHAVPLRLREDRIGVL